MKRLQLLFHSLGMGDVITLSPLVLLAFDQGFAVDFVFDADRVPETGPLLFSQALREGRIRFLGSDAALKERYDVTVVFDRRVLGRVLAGGRAGHVLIIPMLEHRRLGIAVYNTVIATTMRLRGLHPRAMQANPGRGIGQMVFEDFAAHLGVAARYHAYAPRVRALCQAPDTAASGKALVHLFRDHPLRRLDDAALRRIAETLAGPDGLARGEALLLFDPRSPFEERSAKLFAQFMSDAGRGVHLLPAPPLAEVARLLGEAPLYVGVDHGVSHLAGLLCTRSLLLYGGFRNNGEVHRTWPPVMEAEATEQTPQVSMMRSGDRAVAMVHSTRAEYLAHREEDSLLINSAATPENLRLGLSLLGPAFTAAAK